MISMRCDSRRETFHFVWRNEALRFRGFGQSGARKRNEAAALRHKLVGQQAAKELTMRNSRLAFTAILALASASANAADLPPPKSDRAAARSGALDRVSCAKQRLLPWRRRERQLDEFRSPARLCDRNFERLHGWRAVGFRQRPGADQYSHGRQVRVRAIVSGRLLPTLRSERLAMGSETLVQLSGINFDQHELDYPPIRHIHDHSEPYAGAL